MSEKILIGFIFVYIILSFFSFLGLIITGMFYAKDKQFYDKYSKEVVTAKMQNVKEIKISENKYKYNYELVYTINDQQIVVNVEKIHGIVASDYYKNDREIKIKYNPDNKKDYTTVISYTKEYISNLEISMIVFGTILGTGILITIIYVIYNEYKYKKSLKK
jgi:hypothetical protein